MLLTVLYVFKGRFLMTEIRLDFIVSGLYIDSFKNLGTPYTN